MFKAIQYSIIFQRKTISEEWITFHLHKKKDLMYYFLSKQKQHSILNSGITHKHAHSPLFFIRYNLIFIIVFDLK